MLYFGPIEEVLMNFYDDGAVIDTRKIIWKQYVNSLPVLQDHCNTTSTATKREVTDIVNAVKHIDEKHGGMDELPVTFVALKMNMLFGEQWMRK